MWQHLQLICNDIVVLRHTIVMNLFIVDVFSHCGYRWMQTLNRHATLVQARVWAPPPSSYTSAWTLSRFSIVLCFMPHGVPMHSWIYRLGCDGWKFNDIHNRKQACVCQLNSACVKQTRTKYSYWNAIAMYNMELNHRPPCIYMWVHSTEVHACQILSRW